MPKRFRHPQLGYFHKLDLRKTSVTTGFVSDAQLADLVRYLTEAESSKEDKGIFRIVQEMLELEKIEQPVWGETKEEAEFSSGPNARLFLVSSRGGKGVVNPLLKKISPDKYRRQTEIEGREFLLNRELARFHFAPYTWAPHKGQWAVFWRNLSPVPKRRVAHGRVIQLDDGGALQLILDLARAGYLNRLRRCSHCQKWLYAKSRHQNFCSTACQQKHYQDSDEWRRHRREYMRGYRRGFR